MQSTARAPARPRTLTSPLSFQAFGDIEYGTSCMAKDKAKGGTAHKGFGFVVYKDAGSAAKATKAMHGKELQGRMVEVRAEAAAAGTKRVAAAPAAAAPGSAAKKAKSAPAQSSSPITALGNTSWTGMITHS